MSHYDWLRSGDIALADEPFYGLIMAAYRRADTRNRAALETVFPDTCDEFNRRYHAPGGHLTGDHEPAVCAVCADPNLTRPAGFLNATDDDDSAPYDPTGQHP